MMRFDSEADLELSKRSTLTYHKTKALKRGSTVYLVDRRIDMLPSLLGTSKLRVALLCIS